MVNDFFNIYLEPKNEELRDLWEDSIFIFDTSVLLDFYYLPKKLRSEIFEQTLRPIKERIWVPQQVMFEFLKNKESKIKEPIERKYNDSLKTHIAPIPKNIKEIEKSLQEFKNLTKKSDSHPYIENNINELFWNKFIAFRDEFKNYERNIELEFTKRENEILTISENDDILEFITSNLTIGNAFTFDEIMGIVKEGEIRYRNEIPPGYKDAKDKIGTQKYGDLIVWEQILLHAREQKKSVIFILNDVKIDWCYTYTHQREKRISRPREELIKEFHDVTNSRFWMYTLNQFLYNYKNIFDTSLDQNVIDEAVLMIKDNQPKLELELDTGSTREAEDFVKDNIPNIGKVMSIKHTRDMKKIKYKTEIIGEDGILKIYGGLTSGYAGGGPNGFIRVLTLLGINEEIATKYVKGNHEKIYSFEIPFDQYSKQPFNYSTNNCPICGNYNWNGVMCMSCGSMCDD